VPFGLAREQRSEPYVKNPSGECAGKARPGPTSRVAIIIALVLIVTYWIPFAFLVGGFFILSCWDDVLRTRAAQRRWFVLWLIALASVCVGAFYTVYLWPHLAAI
jgi:hypothetical protein